MILYIDCRYTTLPTIISCKKLNKPTPVRNYSAHFEQIKYALTKDCCDDEF